MPYSVKRAIEFNMIIDALKAVLLIAILGFHVYMAIERKGFVNGSLFAGSAIGDAMLIVWIIYKLSDKGTKI